MNVLPKHVQESAIRLFTKNKSIRFVSKQLGISREAAHRIQKFSKQLDVIFAGRCRINTGKSANGRVSYKYSYKKQERPKWKTFHDKGSLLYTCRPSNSIFRFINLRLSKDTWAGLKTMKNSKDSSPI